VKFDEAVRALLILCSFLERWNTLVMVVSNSVSGSNTLKFDDVVGVILLASFLNYQILNFCIKPSVKLSSFSLQFIDAMLHTSNHVDNPSS